MGKHYLKLAAAVSLLLAAVTMLILTSYAWMTLSQAPVVEGFEIVIGGGNTILVAPDITEVVDGRTYHYPGVFSDKLNFSQSSYYRYLSELGGLTPVSTSDGLNWYLPVYYSLDDPDADPLKNGLLRPFEEFTVDNMLAHANLTADQKDQLKQGSYIYLDFWIVSPGQAYDVRVASGTADDGSFAISLPPVTTEEEQLVLGSGIGQASACVRIGFLANTDEVLDDQAMQIYTRSYAYREEYKSLRGVYQEPGYYLPGGMSTTFTIYEPNGDLHPDRNVAGVADGTYVATNPLGPGGVPVSIGNAVTVQRANYWASDANGRLLDQAFKTAITGKAFTEAQAQSYFYDAYLQNQVGHYVRQGSFFTRTSDLYAFAQTGSVAADALGALAQSGATDDVIITTLERKVPQRIRMYIWLEGQDVDCVNSAAGERLVVNIQLAGSNED